MLVFASFSNYFNTTASIFAATLKSYAIGKLIGSPVSERLSSATVVSRITLPNSGEEISISTWKKRRRSLATDKDILMPNILADPAMPELLKLADPDLEAAIRYFKRR